MPNTITSIFSSVPASEPVEAPHPNTGVFVAGTQLANGTWQVIHTLVSKTSTPPTITARLKNFPAVGATGVASGPVLNNVLAAPTGTAATGTSSTALNVTVSSIANQTAYRLLAADAAAGPFTQVYQGLTASYPHTGLVASQTKYYKWQYVGGGYYDDSPMSAVFSGAALAAGDGRVAWAGISAGATIDATTGAITVPSGGGLYSTRFLPPAAGSHITWQLPATAVACKNLFVGLEQARTLGAIANGATIEAGGDGNLYANGSNIGPVVGNMFLRLEIAANGKDFLAQTSPDGAVFTTVRTMTDVAGYFVSNYAPMTMRVYNNNPSATITLGPVTVNNTVAGLVSVAFDGNSLTAGTNSTTGEQAGSTSDFSTSMSFPSQLMRSLTRNAYMAGNFGVSGQTTVQMSSDAATQIDIKIDAVHYHNNILVAWEITNDYCNAGVTKEVAYSDFVSYCTARRAAGWPVVVLNVINRTTNLNARTAADFAAAQTYWNGRLATEFATFADALVDVNALNLQTTANWDGTHPSDPGYALVATAIKTALTPLLA